MTYDDNFSKNLLTKKLTEIVEENLQNEQFGVEELAEKVGISRSHLHRKLQEATGQSISQFIREYRLQIAMELLKNEEITASEVAYQVGFGSATYFSKSFTDFYGYPPGEVKKCSFNNDGTLLDDKIKPSQNRKILILIGVFLIIGISIILYLSVNNHASLKSDAIDKSIVVLPFQNLSNNPDQQFFADGVMEAILNHLTAIEDLRVISRTTAMRYKETNKTLPEIAAELGVSYVLEGGVQESEGMLRVNAQLIQADTDAHLWSEQYDQELKNIFEIQTKIARSIAKQLDIQLSNNALAEMIQPQSKNPEAYKKFLRGKYLIQGNWSLDRVTHSRRFLEKAIELDSTMVEAYVWLALTYEVMGLWYGNISGQEAKNLAQPYYEKALELDPNHPEVLEFLGTISYYLDWDFLGSELLFKKAHSSGNRLGHTDFHLDLMLRRYNKVIDECLREIEDDPFVGTIRWNLAYGYFYTNQKTKALETIEEALNMDSNQDAYYDHFGNLYNAMGMYSEAEQLLTKGLEISAKRHASMVAHLAISNYKLGKLQAANKLIAELKKRVSGNEPEIKIFLAHIYAVLGEFDQAFLWLDESFSDHEVEMLWLQTDPNLLLLKDDPRYQELVDKVGFPQ